MRCVHRLVVSVIAVVALSLTHQAASYCDRLPLKEPPRRALLIGINAYNKEPAKNTIEPTGATVDRPAQRPPARKRGAARGAFINLDGPANDVEAIRELLIKKFAFTQVKVLRDSDATREAILKAIDDMIQQSAPGDICVVYYAGHGSKVKNSKGGEPDGYDESIVPADSNRGVSDIRDKEIARLFLKATGKGVTITGIFDSCHSGSLGRGSFTDQRTREVLFDERDVADPPGFKKSPAEDGALFLYAAQDYQTAQERRYNDAYRGSFSWALSQILAQPSVSINESAEQVFSRVVSYMKGEPGQQQQPAMEGNEQRRKAPLFGGQPNPALNKPTASVIKIEERRVTLEGGLAMGLGVGSELRKAGATEASNVRLRVTRLTGLSSCEAEIIQGNPKSIRRGDLYVLDLWVSKDTARLKVWIPQASDQSEILRIGRELKQLRGAKQINAVDDPTAARADRLVVCTQTGWQVISPAGTAESLDTSLDLRTLAARAASQPVFISLPPSRELREKLKLEAAMEATKTIQEAEYFLAGRLKGDQIEYALVRREALTYSLDNDKQTEYVYPPHSDWISVDGSSDATRTAAEELHEKAVTLARIKGWLQIQPSTSEGFPYRLALRKAGTTDSLREGTLYEDEHYDLLLVADEQALSTTSTINPKWIYVFSLDSHGTCSLLFNRAGNLENRFPLDAAKRPAEQPREILLGKSGMVGIVEPFGLDTYILLASDQELPDPHVVEFTGVQTRGRTDKSDTPLAKLLYGIGSATRGTMVQTPIDWSLDRIYLRSAAKSK